MSSKLKGAIPKITKNKSSSTSNNNNNNGSDDIVEGDSKKINKINNNSDNSNCNTDDELNNALHKSKFTILDGRSRDDDEDSLSGHSLKSKSTNTCLIEKKRSPLKRPATAFELSSYKSQIPDKVFERLNINDSPTISLLYAGSKSNLNVRRFQKD